jgi:subtilase family serine protease
MGVRRGRSVLASLALVGMGVVSPGAGGAATAAGALSNAARILPFAPTHVLSTTLSFPPDTAYCRANLGISCYQPAQFQQAYNLTPLFNAGLTGAGRTIVIVDAFGSPTIKADLAHFDQTFGLPDPPSLQVIQPVGAVNPDCTVSDPFGAADCSGWGVETTLDVEWSHVMAPGANILLVETPTSETEGVQGFPDIVAAENFVINHGLGDVISQSFGATEQTFNSPSEILNLRSAFLNAQQHNVTVLGASGDAGATDLLADTSCCFPFLVNSWPSSDPLVTSVGGTQLLLDANGNRLAPDVVWNDGRGAGGGGVSSVFARPDFQTHVRGVVGGARGTPDISMSAAVDGGVVFYYSFCDYGRKDPSTGTPPLCGPQWHIVGGTSESSPLFSGIVAIADQAVGHRLGDLNPLLYSHLALPGVVDVTSGNNSFAGVTGFDATPGYDLASGIGTVDAFNFVSGVVHLTR